MISLKLFGELEIMAAGNRIDLAGTKLLGLLAILAAAAGKPVARDSVTEMLWGSHFDHQARQNLRQALTRLRKLLGPSAIVADDRFLRLPPTIVTSDLERFRTLSQSDDVASLREATGLAQDEFLAGFTLREPAFSDWLASERRNIAATWGETQRRLARLEIEAGEAGSALARAQALSGHDWLDEEAHRISLAALGRLGRRGEALKLHQAFVERLRRELGVSPEEATLQQAAELKMSPSASASAPAARPSLLVLPFATPGGEPGGDYFAEGMVDELITALSRLRWLSVLSRSSTFSARARGLDARAAGDAFAVRYVLEGSIRRMGPAVRISGQLIEAASGTALWAERFDGNMTELFDLQDRMAARVLGALQPQLERAEIARAQRKPTESLDAYDHYLRGIAEVHRWTREANAAALRHFYRAIELDPNFAAAYGMAARCYSQRRTSSWTDDQAQEQAETERLAHKAAELGNDDPVALSSAGIALAFVAGRVPEGGKLVERSLMLNPGLATAWLYSGWVRAWNCEPDAAIESLNRAIELSPHDPNVASMRRALALAHFIARRYREAVQEALAVATTPQNAGIGSATLAASYEMLGQRSLAVAEAERLLQAEPNLCLANLRSRFPIVQDETFREFADALQRAGLPESPSARGRSSRSSAS